MGLRAKLPTTFLALLTTAIIAVSAIYLDRMLRLMAHGLSHLRRSLQQGSLRAGPIGAERHRHD